MYLARKSGNPLHPNFPGLNALPSPCSLPPRRRSESLVLYFSATQLCMVGLHLLHLQTGAHHAPTSRRQCWCLPTRERSRKTEKPADRDGIHPYTEALSPHQFSISQPSSAHLDTKMWPTLAEAWTLWDRKCLLSQFIHLLGLQTAIRALPP